VAFFSGDVAKMFVNNVLEPEVKKNKKDFSFEKFLEFCKKQDGIIIDKIKTKANKDKKDLE
jgi:hypothetical protein